MYHHYPSDSASPPPHQVHVSIGVSKIVKIDIQTICIERKWNQLITFFCVLQLRRTGEYVPSTIHHPIPHPIYPNNRLRTFSQFVRVIEETDMQLQRSMRGATRVCE